MKEKIWGWIEKNRFAIIAFMFLLLCSSCALFSAQKLPTEILPEFKQPLDKLGWVPLMMMGGVVMGLFGFLNGQKFGMPAMLSCLGGLVLSLTVIKFAFWIALFGGIGVLIALGTFGWSFFNNNKGIVLTTAKKLNGK